MLFCDYDHNISPAWSSFSRFSPICVNVSPACVSVHAESVSVTNVCQVRTYSEKGTQASVFCFHSQLQMVMKHGTGEPMSQAASPASSPFYLLLNTWADPHLIDFVFIYYFLFLLYDQLLLGNLELNNIMQKLSELFFILVCVVLGRGEGGGRKACLIAYF